MTRHLLPGILAVLLAPTSALAECEDCFVIAVLPDTQHYTEVEKQPAGGNHLERHDTLPSASSARVSRNRRADAAAADPRCHPSRRRDPKWSRPSSRCRPVAGRRMRLRSTNSMRAGLPYFVIPGHHDGDDRSVRHADHLQHFDRFLADVPTPCHAEDPATLRRRPPAPQGVGARALSRSRRLRRTGALVLGKWRHDQPPAPAASAGRRGPSEDSPGRHSAGLIATPGGRFLLTSSASIGASTGTPLPRRSRATWRLHFADGRLPGHTDDPVPPLRFREPLRQRADGSRRLWKRNHDRSLGSPWSARDPRVFLTLTGHYVKKGVKARTWRWAGRATGSADREVVSLLPQLPGLRRGADQGCSMAGPS